MYIHICTKTIISILILWVNEMHDMLFSQKIIILGLNRCTFHWNFIFFSIMNGKPIPQYDLAKLEKSKHILSWFSFWNVEYIYWYFKCLTWKKRFRCKDALLTKKWLSKQTFWFYAQDGWSTQDEIDPVWAFKQISYSFKLIHFPTYP